MHSRGVTCQPKVWKAPGPSPQLRATFLSITEVRRSQGSRGSPFAAALACGSKSASWLVSHGPRPFKQLIPLGLSMPISTWARCSAHAPRAAFKQWSFEQRGAAKGSAAPPSPTDHAHQHPSICQTPLCTGPGVTPLVTSGPPKFRSRASCAARGTESAACRRASLARRREDRWNLRIDPRTQRT